MSWRETYEEWLNSPALSEEEWNELKAIGDDEKEMEDRFYAPLAFGTAGLRGVMGLGTNRMNIHIIRHATQAFAELIVSEGAEAAEKGVCICFDIRFPQMFLEMRKMGVRMVFVPAAFNMTTGPAHWKVLFRCRAMDQQIYMLGCAPARDAEGSYVAYGHSILTDPWGRVLAELDEKEGILEATVDLAYTDAVRQQIPLGADL